MASNFPSSLDSFTNPSSSDAMDSVSVPHATQHSDLNDAVEALQAKVGADSSAVTTSHDYKIADHASRLTTLEGAAGSGLVLISRTTVGSAVSSVTVSDAFSTDYDNYKICIALESASADAYLEVQLGSTTTGYYGLSIGGSYTDFNTSAMKYGHTNQANWHNYMSYSTIGGAGTLELQSPYLSQRTFSQHQFSHTGGMNSASGYLNDTTSYSSITFLPSSGTLTGGTIDVYGYVKS